MAHIEIDPAELAVQAALDNFINEFVEQVQYARKKFPGRENPMGIALMEEVGELAKAMLQEDHAAIFLEAVQVATMAFRCHYDGDASTDAFRKAKGLGPSGFPGEIEADPLADAKAAGRKALGLD
jgi:hypothetical protein